MNVNRRFERVCLIGCGLIGGSLSLALKKTGKVRHITGVDLHPRVLEAAVARGVIDQGTERLESGISGADLVIIAAPVPASIEIVREVAKLEHLLAEHAVVTDVCGVKDRVVTVAAQAFVRASFVGGHPMAGSEKSGIWAANDKLFENAVYVLTPEDMTSQEALHDLSDLLRSTGALVRYMSPQLHDRVVAAISHVPHIIAAALVNQVQALAGQDAAYMELAAGGFRDITRIASSDPGLWRDISLENKSEIEPLLDAWIDRLTQCKAAILDGDHRQLEHFFSNARTFRDALPAKSSGAIRPLYSMTVSVPDEPGLIGEVASLLGKKGISIRNIGILESREDDDGQLFLQFDTVEFYDKAAKELTLSGYPIIDRVMS